MYTYTHIYEYIYSYVYIHTSCTWVPFRFFVLGQSQGVQEVEKGQGPYQGEGLIYVGDRTRNVIKKEITNKNLKCTYLSITHTHEIRVSGF